MHVSQWYNGKAILLIILILLEVVFVIFSNLLILLRVKGKLSDALIQLLGFSVFAAFVVAFIALFLVREIVRLAQKEQEATVNEALLNQSKETIDLLRVQRHDFMNHMQVIHGMLQLNKSNKAMEYINEISSEVRSGLVMGNIENPIIVGLLSKKMILAEQCGVRLFVDFQANLENLRISFVELTRIAANLLDNAITAAQQSSNGPGIVEFEMFDSDYSVVISVRNTGAIISEGVREKVFEKGVSTKVEEGHGYGLFIVKSIVESYGGNVSFVSSEEEGTTFVVSIPITITEAVV